MNMYPMSDQQGMNGEDNYYGSDGTDTVHITVNSSDEGSINGRTTRPNVDPPGVKNVVKPTLPAVRSIFQRPLSQHMSCMC